jgi:septin family protein
MEFMKQLHDKVNIIPVIAKADTLTEEEIAHFKAQARHATPTTQTVFPFYIVRSTRRMFWIPSVRIRNR